ncbi:Peroxisomal targeting signal receptor [Verticillium dahliae VDG2]|nr:Peroxisomal targeting signal receptor [Verticillium dahliae VDG2]
MDANPAPGAVPAVAGIDKGEQAVDHFAAPFTASCIANFAVCARSAKRKADELEPEGDGAAPTNGDAKKRKPGRPPKAAAANGTENGNGHGHGEDKEGLGEKLAKKVKKVLPAPGKTARKTRSQGPA